ncbi:MAG: MarR family winged helix-turn-helix transcriptional regulator [Neomegalonema sp.]|nr:MarR family winged helix-turn-helix transcriptional regulator [Neomegalonema sp.]
MTKPTQSSQSKPVTRADQPTQVGDQMLRAFTGYRLKRAYLTIEREVNDLLAEHGLKVVTFSALAVVIENPDLTQSTLAEALALKRSSVVVIVDQLENDELIVRNPVEGDRRSYALRVTLRGRRLYDRIAAAIEAREAALQAGLSEQERHALRRFLGVIEGNDEDTGEA